MREAGTVAVLLPGAYYTLRDTHLPPIAALRAAGVPMAVATDHNPGTSPVLSLLLMMNMACTLFRLTVPEALAGVTRHAARALGLQRHARRDRRRQAGQFRAVGASDRPPSSRTGSASGRCARVVRQGRIVARRRTLARRREALTAMPLFARDALLPDGWARNVLLEWDAARPI